ncbi:MAG: hypothetical protein DMD74_02105 [Gemmatimonadetes bacterium]|nr:MAG: hypothetical protein DMD74_02105 [Gemmatimonadota bacterium]
MTITLAFLIALAGDTVSGRIVDSAGSPLPAAAVQLVELHRTTLAASDGGFSLPDVPPGRYTLVVRHPGYAAVVRPVVVAGPVRVDLVLEPAPFEVEPITVTATRAPLANLGSPLPVASLGPDALRRQQSVSLAHALAALPGVRVLGTGEQIGKPVIRGMTGARVLVLEDGSRLEDYSWSDEDGPSVDARFAERVEVIRGPASVLYGSDALGGVVNVIPADLPDAAGGPGFLRGRVEAYGASNNIEVGSAVTLEGASRRVGWRVLGVGRFAGSLHTPAGELDNTGFGAFSGEGAVGVRGARSDAQLRLSHYGGEFKLLEANKPPGPEAGGPARKMEDDRLQFTAGRSAGALRLELKAQWQRHNLIEVSDEASGGGPPTESTAFDLLLNTGTLDLLAHHGGDRMRGTVGFSGIGQWNDSRGPIPLVPDARVRGAAAFLFEEVRMGRWSVLAGARADARRVAADPDTILRLTAQRRSWSALSGDAGLVFRPVERLAFAANAADGAVPGLQWGFVARVRLPAGRRAALGNGGVRGGAGRADRGGARALRHGAGDEPHDGSAPAAGAAGARRRRRGIPGWRASGGPGGRGGGPADAARLARHPDGGLRAGASRRRPGDGRAGPVVDDRPRGPQRRQPALP